MGEAWIIHSFKVELLLISTTITAIADKTMKLIICSFKVEISIDFNHHHCRYCYAHGPKLASARAAPSLGTRTAL